MPRRDGMRVGRLLTYWRVRVGSAEVVLVMFAMVMIVVKVCLVWPLITTTITTSSPTTLTPHTSRFRWRQSDDPEYHSNHDHDHDHNHNHNPNTLALSVRGYTVPNCPCVRFGFDVKGLEESREKALVRPWRYPKWFVDKFNFSGQSTCSDYSTQRGGGQKVVSYSYYNALGVTDPDSIHFKKYMGQLHGRARVIAKVYPDWIMRIYHNVSSKDFLGTKFLCNIICTHEHVDLCDVTNLPTLDNLVERGVVGRLWRFSVMGDPSVKSFLSRDSDSWVMGREVVVVREWLKSKMEFHVIRDHPNHKAVMLAGLWGGHNTRPMTLAKIRDAMFIQPINLTIKFDQYLLASRLWPIVKNSTLQHDSYNCLMKSHRGSKPFPVKRVDGLYCGWGPFKFHERRVVFNTRCPRECRPSANISWIWC